MLKLTRATPVHVGFKLFSLLWHTSTIKPDIKIFINFYLKFQNFTPYPKYLHPLRIKLKDFWNKIIFPFSRFFPLKLSHRSLGKYLKSNKNVHNFQLFFIISLRSTQKKFLNYMIICGRFMMKVST